MNNMADKVIIREVIIKVKINPDTQFANLSVTHNNLSPLEAIAYLEHAKNIIITGSKGERTMPPSIN